MEIYGDTYSVYVHINRLNNKIYVGSTGLVPATKRWRRNGLGYKRNKRFYDDIQKYGWDNFDHEIVASGLTPEEAGNFEKLLIRQTNATSPEFGYNTEIKGQTSNEKERRRKVSESLLGDKHRMYGKRQPEEVKAKISASLSGKNHYWYGKHHSEETLAKLSEYAKANHIEDRLKEANEAKRMSVICVETGISYKSIAEAAAQTGTSRVVLMRVIHGKGQTAGGYHWKLA